MGLAITFDLGGFVERLPTGAVLCIFAVDSFAGEKLDNRKHAAVAQIAVMRQSEDLGAGFFLAHGHPLPEVAGIGTSERWLGGEGLDQARLCAIVAPDDVAMKIVSPGIRGPFITDKGSEAARIVRLFRRLDRLAPSAAVGGRARRRETFRQLAFAETGNDIDGGLRSFAGIDLVIPFAALRRRHQRWIGAHQLRKKSHAIRVVRHDQKIQRPRKFRMLPARRDDLLALGETISVLGTEPGTECTGVH